MVLTHTTKQRGKNKRASPHTHKERERESISLLNISTHNSYGLQDKDDGVHITKIKSRTCL